MATPLDPISALVNVGVIGIILVLILLRRLAPGWSLDDAVKRAEKAEAQRDALVETMKLVGPVLDKVLDEVLPALKSAQGDLQGAGRELKALTDEVRRMSDGHR